MNTGLENCSCDNYTAETETVRDLVVQGVIEKEKRKRKSFLNILVHVVDVVNIYGRIMYAWINVCAPMQGKHGVSQNETFVHRRFKNIFFRDFFTKSIVIL